MDIDQLMREYACLDKRQVADEVKFTPSLESSIRSKIRDKRKSSLLRYGVGMTSLAAALWILAIAPWNDHTAMPQQVESNVALHQKDQKQLAQAVLQRMYKIVPELKTYQVVEIGATNIQLQKNTTETANIQFRSQTGDIELFMRDTVGQTATLYPTVALAKEKAALFLQQILGDEGNQYHLDIANNVANGKLITFQRYYNGLPVLWDTITVAVDVAGNIVHYEGLSRNWDLARAQFADPKAAISQEQAIHQLMQNMKLRYVEDMPTKLDPTSGQPIEKKTILEYSPVMVSYREFSRLSPDWTVDALTGKFQPLMEEPQQSFAVNTQAERVKVKSLQDVARLIEDIYGIPVDQKQLRVVIPKANTPIDEVLYIPRNGSQINVTYFKSNGTLLSIETTAPVTKLKIGKDEAVKAAVKFLEKYADPSLEEVSATKVRESGSINRGSYEINFYQKHNGILVTNPASFYGPYTVFVDPATGQVNGFRRESYTVREPTKSYPSNQSLVPLEVAMREYLQYVRLKLAYQYERTNGNKQATYRLVYIPYPVNPPGDSYKEVHLDAVTGRVWEF